MKEIPVIFEKILFVSGTLALLLLFPIIVDQNFPFPERIDKMLYMLEGIAFVCAVFSGLPYVFAVLTPKKIIQDPIICPHCKKRIRR